MEVKHRETFQQVLLDCDDQVTVRDILHMVLTREQQAEVADLFNKHANNCNQRKREFAAPMESLTREQAEKRWPSL